MGIDRPGSRAGGGGGALTGPAARVVPRVPTFQVDRGFWYRIPAELAVDVGSIVRIPLGGRRVRGFVVELGERPLEGLRDIAALTGDGPVFDEDLLQVMSRIAHHYVAPLSTVLDRAAPPNAPRHVRGNLPEVPHPPSPGAGRPATGHRSAPTYLLDRPGDHSRLADAVAEGLRDGTALVVAPTGGEVTSIARTLEQVAPGRVVTVLPESPAAETTRAWGSVQAGPGRVLVGTARVSLWQLARPRLFMAIEEGRRAMKERQTPTIHVREVLSLRARTGNASLTFSGPTPSLEAMAMRPSIVAPTGRLRAWPLVEVVDRAGEPPGPGVLGPRARSALRSVATGGGFAFVFTHRHGYAPASRCVRCRALRRCPTCGSRPDQGDTCLRCGSTLGPCQECGGRRFEALGAGEGRVLEELTRLLGDGLVGPAGSRRPVVAGTERDIPGLPPQDLAVAVDADGLILGSNYRAAEEALRVLARVAGTVRTGRGRRMLLQTSRPDDPVVTALERGDPLSFLDHELTVRRHLGLPPAGQLLVVEVRSTPDSADADLRSIAGDATEVLGPAPGGRGDRWLVRGADLGPLREGLRPVVQRWRDAGATVRIDADPIDL